MSTSSSAVPPLHQGIDTTQDASSTLADSENSASIKPLSSLVTLLSSKILKEADFWNDVDKLSSAEWKLARRNLQILGHLDRSLRVAEANARGSHCGLK